MAYSNPKKKKIKVLVAEDDKFISFALAKTLDKAGFEVLAAFDGAKAIEILGGEKPDIILLDLIMPVKNGFEVLDEIRKDKVLSSIPVMVLSNLEDDISVLRARGYGVAEYLIKSNFSIQEVIDKIKNHIK